MAASVYNPYCFCDLRYVTTKVLFIMIFRFEVYYSDTICRFFLIYQVQYAGLIVCRLIVTPVSISNDNTIHYVIFVLVEVIYNFWIIKPTISFIIFLDF